MPMYNLLEYSDNYSMTSGTFWNYYRDKLNDAANENYAASNQINNSQITASKSIQYKTKLIGNAQSNNSRLNAEIVVPLKYLSNFQRFPGLPLVNCEIKLDQKLCNI